MKYASAGNDMSPFTETGENMPNCPRVKAFFDVWSRNVTDCSRTEGVMPKNARAQMAMTVEKIAAPPGRIASRRMRLSVLTLRNTASGTTASANTASTRRSSFTGSVDFASIGTCFSESAFAFSWALG